MEKLTSPLSRRGFIKLAGTAFACGLLSGCGPDDTPLRSAGPAQLVYQDWRTEWFPAMAQEMLGDFNSSHPGIQVFYVPDPEDKAEKLSADFAAGTGPDLLSGCCDFFSAWAEAGYLLDLRPYVETDLPENVIEDWSTSQYNALFTSNGLQYALPMYHGALALFYNKDLFDAAGVAYPTERWTYTEYLDAMKKLTVREGSRTVQWGSMFDVSWERIQVHVNSWGGHLVDPQDRRRCAMADQPALDAMEWLRARIWDDDVMATYLDVENLSTTQAFISQQVAMVEDGSWALKAILENADFRIGVAPFPAGPERRATLATTDGFAINAVTKHPDQAWEFLKFLISKDYGRAMARAHLLQPARTSLVVEWIDFIRQQYPEKAAGMNLVAFADGQIKGYSVIAETFNDMTGVSQITQEAWDQVFTLGNAPVTIMQDVCQEINSLPQNAGSGNDGGTGCRCTSPT